MTTFSCVESWREVCSTWRLKSERMRRTVNPPTVTANAQRITNVRSADTTANRVRMGSLSKAPDRRSPQPPPAPRTLRAKDVASSFDGVQQPRLAARLELAAQ